MNPTSVIEVFGAMVAALGGYESVKWLVGFIAHRKQEKRLKKLEADKKETEVDADEFHLYKERIDELREANAELGKQNLELLKSGARKDEIIEDKTAKIRELNDKLLEATRRIGFLERLLQHYKNWFCKREVGDGKEDCRRRQPDQNPPLKFKPIDDTE